ncbi:hypothetical protein P031_gp45 [Pelagibacter phage HTVC031P]|jgi:hypothetical protein|nr:hypothetical protein P031_gp45 [Pelagibacter phage HTVC031P]
MRDTKLLEKHHEKQQQNKKQNELFKNLKKEVNIGANGTQSYTIKKGVNMGKEVSKCLK